MPTSETPISGATADPAAATETVAYTSPAAGAGSIISAIHLANRHATADCTVRLGVSPGGGVLVNAEYIAYDMKVRPGDPIELGHGITLDPNDEIRVYTDNATLSVSVFGMELGA